MSIEMEIGIVHLVHYSTNSQVPTVGVVEPGILFHQHVDKFVYKYELFHLHAVIETFAFLRGPMVRCVHIVAVVNPDAYYVLVVGD